MRFAFVGWFDSDDGGPPRAGGDAAAAAGGGGDSSEVSDASPSVREMRTYEVAVTTSDVPGAATECEVRWCVRR